MAFARARHWRHLFRRLPSGRAGQDHGHHAPFEHRRALDRGHILQLHDHLLQQLAPQVGMGHLATTEHHGNLDLVPLAEELLDLADLDGQIVIVGLGAHADLFELRCLLALAGFVFLLLLLVLEPAIVHKTADRGNRHGRDFDQIEVTLPRDGERLHRGHYPDDLAFFVNQPHLARAHPLIDPQLFLLLPVVAPKISVDRYTSQCPACSRAALVSRLHMACFQLRHAFTDNRFRV